MFLLMVNSQRQKIYSWRHSPGDHMLRNPVSVVILEWTLCYMMFCVILFGVCSHSRSRLVTSDDRLTQHTHQRHFCSPSPWLFSSQVNERGGVREEREEQGKHNGGLYEEAAPTHHRKPERTLRYTDAATHIK